MKGIEAVKKCMSNRNFSQTKLANEMGFKYQSGVSNMLQRDDIRSEHLVNALKALGYELVIRDKFSKEEIIIDGE